MSDITNETLKRLENKEWKDTGIQGLEGEIWKSIKDFDNYYISNLGRVNNMLHARNNNLLHPRRGSNCSFAKLTENDVKKIKKLAGIGSITLTALAKEYKVSPSTLSCAISGKNWKHVN